MDNLTKLKLLIQEKKYPYFTDEELNNYLEIYSDVKLTAAKLCLMKADMEKTIKVGPITIENPEPAFWTNLSNEYMSEYQNSTDISTGTGYYKSSMKRDDER